METVYLTNETIQDVEKGRKKVVALGNFDGLHLGHSKVIETGRALAKEKGLALAVMSFTPHPRTVLQKQQDQFHYLMPLREKQEKLAALGVDYFYLVEFTLDFARLLPEQFEVDYLLGVGASDVVAGFDYKYGFKGAGTLAGMALRQPELCVTEVAKVSHDGEKISSTSIRTCLAEGRTGVIQHMLGQPYHSEFVRDGSHFVPSANRMMPKPGRYRVKMTCSGRSFQTTVAVDTHGQIEMNRQERQQFSQYYKLIIEWHEQVS